MDAEGVPYLGQMDLNIRSGLVWDFYRNTLKQLKAYGAGIVRLDAFAYAPKAPGRKNFLNEPETWDVLERVKDIASEYGLKLLPENHATYSEGIYDLRFLPSGSPYPCNRESQPRTSCEMGR